ncbi:hypothetical protein CCHR01_19992 [Colletotrichum chrysophilum]|uniref:Uncharacterized protein n=1 Tax=Colletotrichum chrysophilum TaxID=1836956 RepID=A0AAD8ZXG0_9PEZI|nr:hypothetical protein CCHR01_19992 [Colletotrichum chrysophilum]
MDLEELAVAKSSYQKDVLLTDLTATEGGLKRRRRRKTPSIEHVLARESLGIVLREKLVGLRLSKTGLSFVVENVSAEQERRFVATDRKPVARWARYHIRARRKTDSRTG